MTLTPTTDLGISEHSLPGPQATGYLRPSHNALFDTSPQASSSGRGTLPAHSPIKRAPEARAFRKIMSDSHRRPLLGSRTETWPWTQRVNLLDSDIPEQFTLEPRSILGNESEENIASFH